MEAVANQCVKFFPAEDGIRDYKVTGVQTCALPICWCGYIFLNNSDGSITTGTYDSNHTFTTTTPAAAAPADTTSTPPHVSHHAHHAHPHVAVEAALDASPQWTLALENLARQGRADHRDRLGLVQIALIEVAAGHQRNAHRREIPGAGEPESGVRELIELAA